MEFHVSRAARDRYQFDLSIYNLRGNVVFANFYAARSFADRMNQKRDLVRFPEQVVRPGKINAMGLIDEILHIIMRQFLDEINPHALKGAISRIEAELGPDALISTLQQFVHDFPPLAVYQQIVSVEEYLAGQTESVPNKEIALEELMALWLANNNPAFSPYIELFDDSKLKASTPYLNVLSTLRELFGDQPALGSGGVQLLDLLATPARLFPHSLEDQLAYLLEKWGTLLEGYVYRILSSLDLVKEEERPVFVGPGPSEVPDYQQIEMEPEQFSQDLDWMPEVVLIAKNVYVWLDQLSKAYSRPITRLDQIPGEELSKLRDWGITGLWLIGLWERSRASKKIKNFTGNPDAASAYSLYEYQIATELGGDQAYQDLKWRASEVGIRLASDMVPNHMGIDSPWVIEHPDWFISLNQSPFPAYSFGGGDLSDNPGVGLFLEDHYYDQTDAAVVFRRLDRGSDTNRFIYHGNDGTNMPWNDTAQINFLHPEAREAVIQTILQVARMFPIIRFDAAMTLAKRHYQRLWFPEPGTGGAIPSRAGNGLTKKQFDEAMPVEFWREVVDRVAKEVPNTLLLAEAFWLMEGFFVRTLGMHRVYNSAFMNMLRDEDNAGYRNVMKNTLQFDPQIMKRFVNFMNNPDERTAVDQFGKGDKYFGICTLMATLPGLPMFGHGQIEGFTEKYGMEFRKAAWEELSDPYLVSRHEHDIFPLLHKRRMFAEVDHFLLYDFVTPSGHVNEDVFAFSNRLGEDRVLVVYHNRYAETSGKIQYSVAFAGHERESAGKGLITKSLTDGLGLTGAPDHYVIIQDQVTGLETLYRSGDLASEGLELNLPAYRTKVFVNIREIHDVSSRYHELERYLNGRGVPSIDLAMQELLLQPIHAPFRAVLNSEFFKEVRSLTVDISVSGEAEEKTANIAKRVEALFASVAEYAGAEVSGHEAGQETVREIETLLSLALNQEGVEVIGTQIEGTTPVDLQIPEDFYLALAWVLLHNLGVVVSLDEPEKISRAWFDEWLLSRILEDLLSSLGFDAAATNPGLNLIKALINQQGWEKWSADSRPSPDKLLEEFIKDPDSSQFLGINRYSGILWLNRDRLGEFLAWLEVIASIQGAPQAEADLEVDPNEAARTLAAIAAAAGEAAYQVEETLAVLQRGGAQNNAGEPVEDDDTVHPT